MLNLLLVMLGGGLGAGARHLVNMGAARAPVLIPWQTAAINLCGSFLIGLLAGWFARRAGTAPELRLFLITGVLGGFTTFSAFSLDFATLWQGGRAMQAAIYVAASVGGSLLAVFLGLGLARTLP
ncbi:MAG: fluoride efflux transporter CrcB [Mesorhizobium amorphae]|nr:MAG: fluoride efflux transporter CrcB [Mesorhizobium amorphae]